MALKPTIYKFNLTLSDMDRDYYDSVNVTVAQHASETLLRMSARLLAYCINANPELEFTRGVSAVDEPDLWGIGLDGQINLWVDVGEPTLERIKKASRRAKVTKIYTFNSKSDVWWPQIAGQVSALGVEVYRLQLTQLEAMASLLQRTNQLGVTISEQSAGIAINEGYCEVSWQLLNPH